MAKLAQIQWDHAPTCTPKSLSLQVIIVFPGSFVLYKHVFLLHLMILSQKYRFQCIIIFVSKFCFIYKMII
jgi:hypothetical protein